jgi:hypothetical protein
MRDGVLAVLRTKALVAVLAIQVDDVIAGRMQRFSLAGRGFVQYRGRVLDALPHRMPDVVTVDGLVQATLSAGLVAFAGPVRIANALAIGHVVILYCSMVYCSKFHIISD